MLLNLRAARKFGFLIIALSLAGCSGGASVTPGLGAQNGTPASTAQQQTSGGNASSLTGVNGQAISVSPSSLTFASPTAAAQSVVASENFAGTVSASAGTCATVSPASQDVAVTPRSGGIKTATFSVAPVAAGTCTVTLTDKKGNTAPVAITVGSLLPGNLYVADYGNNAIKEVLAAGGYTTILTLATGYNATGVAVDASGDVFMADNGAGSSGGGAFEILASGGSIPPSPTINQIGSELVAPFGIGVDGAGNVYVTGYGDSLVKELLAPTFSTINVLGSGFNSPDGVAIDAAGNVFVSDAQNNAVKEISVGGAVRTLGNFSLPVAVAVDAAGNVYLAEAGTHLIKEMLAVGGSIPGSPTVRTLGSGFNSPTGIAVDATGDVFVSDYGTIKEMLAVGGSVPDSPIINTVGSGFAGTYRIAIH